MTAFQIDDRQAPHPDRTRAIRMHTFIVRSTMHCHATHSRQQRRIGHRAVELDDSVYAAHSLRTTDPERCGGPGFRPALVDEATIDRPIARYRSSPVAFGLYEA